MTEQEQFLDVIDRDEAERRFHAALVLCPLGVERVALAEAWGRVLAADVVAPVDVPAFDRANVDGYALCAAETFEAREESPRRARLRDESLRPGRAPDFELRPGEACAIATGAMLPRGADCVVMVEHSEVRSGDVLIYRSATAGAGLTFAGTDISAGEIVLRRRELLSSRETGVLAALGVAQVDVWRRPKVTIVSTGDEIIAPGQPMGPALVYDSNARILADAVRELGGEPHYAGIVPDRLKLLRTALQDALAKSDVVLLSGGTSKGEGDLCYRAVAELRNPGIVAHGVALKPGKPICLAVSDGRPVVVLPGFPTSAIFTFHEFVAPVLRAFAGRDAAPRAIHRARMAVQVNSEIGRTEYLLVGLVRGRDGLSAFPMGKGSGSVTAFSRADGFVTIPRHTEIVAAGDAVDVQALGDALRLADLVAIGSHCVGLDWLLGRLQDEGFHAKSLAVGSTGGLRAAERGECDIAGVHLMDPTSGVYNVPFLAAGTRLLRGYGRRQGLVYRRGDARFEGADVSTAVGRALADTDCRMVNRNQGSGTRVLLDRLLHGATPPGHAVAARSHNAVAAAVAQCRADWGMAIDGAARHYGLGFLYYQDEQFDFVVPADRWDRPAVAALRRLLTDAAIRESLAQLGFFVPPNSGEEIRA